MCKARGRTFILRLHPQPQRLTPQALQVGSAGAAPRVCDSLASGQASRLPGAQRLTHQRLRSVYTVRS